MYKLLVVLCLCMGFAFTAKGLPKAKVKLGAPAAKVLRFDTITPKLRNFNQKALDNYLNDPNFNYTDAPRPDDTWWDRFWRAFWRFINHLFARADKTVSGGSAMTSIFWALVVILVIYIVIRAIGLENIFSRQPKPVELPFTETLENIHEISFDEQLEKALIAHNYKAAVRLLYLRSLKQLSDAGLIHWTIEKTNSAYLNELTGSNCKQLFGVLTRQFEYIWYGDFPVDGQSFKNIDALFAEFKKMFS